MNTAIVTSAIIRIFSAQGSTASLVPMISEYAYSKTLSTMAGHQLPFLSLIVPLYMIRCMCSWRQTLQVWPALLMAGGSFADFESFAVTNPDLMQKSALARWYAPERLNSDLARRAFLLPDPRPTP